MSPIEPDMAHGQIVPTRPYEPALLTPAPLRVIPWITDGATAFLEAELGHLRASGREVHALECGSGSSTVYLGQRVARLVSFEHDATWHTRMRAVMSGLGFQGIEWRTAPRPYWPAFADYPDESFDIVLVDGRDRTACVEASRRLIRPGGLMIVDNTERISGVGPEGPYFGILAHLQGWPAIHFEQVGVDNAGWMASHRWITSIWRKPDPETAMTQSTTAGDRL